MVLDTYQILALLPTYRSHWNARRNVQVRGWCIALYLLPLQSPWALYNSQYFVYLNKSTTCTIIIHDTLVRGGAAKNQFVVFKKCFTEQSMTKAFWFMLLQMNAIFGFKDKDLNSFGDFKFSIFNILYDMTVFATKYRIGALINFRLLLPLV